MKIEFVVRHNGEEWIVETFVNSKQEGTRGFDTALEMSDYMERFVVQRKTN